MTTMKGVMRQIEEKYCRHRITCLVWSDKLDLIAVANAAGEITLHRLNWQRVWYLPPPEKDVLVTTLAWRPDARAIAVAYSNQEIFIINVEKKIIANKFKVNDQVCFLKWVDESASINRIKEYYYKMKDVAYVTKLAPFTGSDGNEVSDEIFVKLQNQNRVNFLIIGLENGEIKISAYGILICGVVSVKQCIAPNSVCKITYADITQDFTHLFVLVTIEQSDGFSRLNCAIFDLYQLSKYSSNIYILAHQCASVLRIVDYMDYAINSIVEAWENILINEMMLKLNEYAEGKPECTLSTEFLELLIFGTYMPSLEHFLQKELSENHLKRISASIEMSHSSMTKLVIQHLRPATENLMFELTVLRGVIKTCTCTENQESTEKALDNCLTAAGAVHIKTNEMISVLEESQLKYKGFFRWLATVYSVFSDERVPTNGIADVTQRELRFITEYLYNIDRLSGEPGHPKEELGQFLTDENLSVYRTDYQNTWVKLLKDNPCLMEQCGSIIPPNFEEFSLVQQQNYMKEQINKFFDEYSRYVTNNSNMEMACMLACTNSTMSVSKVIASVNGLKFLVGLMKVIEGKTCLEILEITNGSSNFYTQSITLSFDEEIEGGYQLLDMQFYTESVISLLLDKSEEGDCSYYAHLPIESLSSYFPSEEIRNLFSIINKDLRIIENMKVSRIAVSGIRRLLVVISDDGHKVRIFEMEADEEEDITSSITNNTDGLITPKSRKSADGGSSMLFCAETDASCSEKYNTDDVIQENSNILNNDTIPSVNIDSADDTAMSLDLSSLNISPINMPTFQDSSMFESD